MIMQGLGRRGRWLLKRRPPGWGSRRGQRRWFQALLACSVLALTPNAWLFVTQSHKIGTVQSVPASPVAIVFGAGLMNGKPSPYLAHRLDAALELYRANKVQAILVTGDNGTVEYDETDAMRTYLIERGVPEIRVVGDYAGFDTWDSCTRAHRIFGVDKAVLISQTFHVRRALALCRAAGIESSGVGVEEWHDTTWHYGEVREIGSAAKAFLNVLVRPDPTLLGRHEDGVERALADAARG
ncbi:vancomycin high temperature exclusion protein [Kitasatospora sp. NPDC051984]|uniref:vancomycin high temperature exclusion protein n=1 Tax=Kitasatospora sp. NPDC051984 TaxID=3364059 RepID=UPI0037C5A9AF